MSTASIPPRRALAVLSTAAALATLAIGSITSNSAASRPPARENTITPKAFALHDAMRALWQAHGHGPNARSSTSPADFRKPSS